MSKNGVQDPAVLIEDTFYLEAGKLQEAETRFQEYLASMKRAGVDVPNKHQKTVDDIEPLHSTLALDKHSSTILDTLNKISEEYGEMKRIIAKQASDIQDIVKRLDSLELKESRNEIGKEKQKKLYTKLIQLKVYLQSQAGEEKLVSLNKNKTENILKNGTTEDDDIDLFGSDEETEEERRVKEDRLKAYENKKAKKTQVVAKSSVVLDVKPWSDETDLQDMEIKVRKIESAGLKWGASKLVPLAYGIKKLQVIAIVEDDNCSIDWLQEQIENIEDLVQSVDIAAFNKL